MGIDEQRIHTPHAETGDNREKQTEAIARVEVVTK